MAKREKNGNVENDDKLNAATLAWTYEASQVWIRFSVMLVVHAIILGVIGQVAIKAIESGENSPRVAYVVITMALCGFGCWVANIWKRITEMGFQWSRARFERARVVETRKTAKVFAKIEPDLKVGQFEIPAKRLTWSFFFLYLVGGIAAFVFLVVLAI